MSGTDWGACGLWPLGTGGGRKTPVEGMAKTAVSFSLMQIFGEEAWTLDSRKAISVSGRGQPNYSVVVVEDVIRAVMKDACIRVHCRIIHSVVLTSSGQFFAEIPDH